MYFISLVYACVQKWDQLCQNMWSICYRSLNGILKGNLQVIFLKLSFFNALTSLTINSLPTTQCYLTLALSMTMTMQCIFYPNKLNYWYCTVIILYYNKQTCSWMEGYIWLLATCSGPQSLQWSGGWNHGYSALL